MGKLRGGSLLVIGGDGIGPEVTQEAHRVLEKVLQKSDLRIEFSEKQFGLKALELEGKLCPDSTLEAARKSTAVLFGAVGGPEYETLSPEIRKAGGLLKLRKELGVYANIRPVKPFSALLNYTPFKTEFIQDVDLVIVRELNGGVYFGEPRGITAIPGGRRGVDTQVYTTEEIHRIARVAFTMARKRKSNVVSVDKANVMESGKLWRQEVQALGASEFKDVTFSHMFADNCAMQLVRKPKQFDVILTDNLFGDILSDCAAPIMGSLGMLPSASLNYGPDQKVLHGLYEPVHGSAPDISGKGIANPIGAILSAAMALRYSFEAPELAEKIEVAVSRALSKGVHTADISRGDTKAVGSREFGDAVIAELGS